MSNDKETYEVIEYVSLEDLKNENRQPMYWSKGREKEWEEKALEMINIDNKKDRKLYSMILNMSERINAVRQLHFDNPHKNGCDACSADWNHVKWPCNTLMELDGIDEDTIIAPSNFEVTTIVIGNDGSELAVLKPENQLV